MAHVNVCRCMPEPQWPFDVPGILVRRGSVRRATGEQRDHYRLTKTCVVIVTEVFLEIYTKLHNIMVFKVHITHLLLHTVNRWKRHNPRPTSY